MTELRQRPAPGMIYIYREERETTAAARRGRGGGGERFNKCTVLKA